MDRTAAHDRRPLTAESFDRRLWRAFLRPGARLMGQLRLRGKVILVVAAATLPVLALLAMSIHGVSETRRRLADAHDGVVLLRLAYPVTAATQRLRGTTARALQGEAAAGAMRQDARQALVQAVGALDQALKRSDIGGLQAQWAPVKAQLDDLAQDRYPMVPDAADAAHTKAIAATEDFAHRLTDSTGLSRLDDAQAQILTDAVLHALMPLMESVGNARDAGTVMLARGAATAAERGRILGEISRADYHAAQIAVHLAALERAGGTIAGSWPGTRSATATFAAETRRNFEAELLNGDALAHFDAGTTSLQHAMALLHDAMARVDDRVEQARAGVHRRLLLAVAGCLLVIALLGYLVWCFYVTLQSALREVLRSTLAVSRGDLSTHVAVRGKDELADIGRAIDAMNDRLSGMVSEIRSNAARVDVAGTQVAQGSAQLALRTDDQAQSLASSVAAIAQLTTAVADNAQAARTLDEVTQQLFAQAEQGHAAMAETLTAMQEVQDSSQRVTDIVSVIDDVAFHTGMLAINAAVEAARAGESGKGFAVVAGEVRQLAQRCAESAEQIRSLIGTAGSQVEASSQKLQHASIALDTIVNGVREVSGSLGAIASASTMQSDGLQEVSANVGALDAITRENAAMVEESHAAAQVLVGRAEALTTSVASMRLRHGSADEAAALVTRALAHVQAVGRSAAIADFNGRPEWIDRDLYLFAIDRLGTFVVFGGDPAVVGSNVSDAPGIAGTDFVDRVWDAVERGGDWVRYDVRHPLTGTLTPKESWVVLLDDDTLIGCGAYLNVQAVDTSMPARAESWSRRAATLVTRTA